MNLGSPKTKPNNSPKTNSGKLFQKQTKNIPKIFKNDYQWFLPKTHLRMTLNQITIWSLEEEKIVWGWGGGMGVGSSSKHAMESDKSKIILINCVVMPLFGLNQWKCI